MLLINLKSSLSKSDIHASIEQLSQKAVNRIHKVASVCIYPAFISYIKSKIHIDIFIGTVLNFPDGNASLDSVAVDIKNAIKLGVDKIDLVILYVEYFENGTYANIINMV